MAKPEHLEILKQGVEVWNRWREEHSDIKPDLVEANLYGMRLERINFRGTILRKANLGGVDFFDADLRGADLKGANLFNANLFANLSGANLSGANLVEADLRLANLAKTNLSKAN